MFVDSHAHLAMAAFADDADEVVARAGRAGVAAMMTCATSLADAARNLEIAAAHSAEGVKASIGFHPHQAKEWTGSSEDDLRALIAAHPGIAAVGEVGLDFHYSFSPHDLQQDVMRRQAALARSVGLPLIIHSRSARRETAEILDHPDAREAGGVLHCFSEDAAFARFCLDRGYYVSFSGIVTFRNAGAIREAAEIVPLDRLLVETDSPYLAPVPHRGRRNEPAFVVEVARHLATLKRVSLEAIAEATTANFARLFGGRA